MFSDKLDFSADNLGEAVDIPDDPGPAVLDNTPVIGTLRRENGVPVLRDKLKDL